MGMHTFPKDGQEHRHRHTSTQVQRNGSALCVASCKGAMQKESIVCVLKMLPGCKPGVYFATVILEVLDICHKKKLLFERCLQRRLRVRLGGPELVRGQ